MAPHISELQERHAALTAEFNEQPSRALQGRLKVKILGVERVIKAIQTGQYEYGVCMTCREPISPRRLAAIPEATECIQCAQASDRRTQWFHTL
ncbi:MAG: TraR/DksA C4-type zinc finger protein [bacterium]